MLNSYFYYILAAVAEIAGCYAFWYWMRKDGSVLILIPGLLFLILFALFLAKIDSDFAGRAYAAYGGIYITASIIWLWLIEKKAPDFWDLAGMFICLVGSCVILLVPRNTI